MRALKVWRASEASLRPPVNSVTCVGSGNRYYGWRLVQIRSRGLLRKAARAQLEEKNAKNCLVLSPEDKILNRLDSYSSLLPCPSHKLPPRIEHLVCLEDGYVVELVSKSLDLPPKFVEELVDFGAIYHALVCPPPPEGSLSPLQWQLYKKAVALSHDKKRPSLKGKTIAEAQKTCRVASIYEGIEAGSYLRVHVHLKRFPRCYEIDWNSRIIAHTESYVILDKPHGVPVGHSLDNFVECCAVFASHALGLPSPLKLTHQLDNCTGGCVVLAKTKEFSSEFHSQLRRKEVKKLYLVLAAAPVRLGVVTHYMRPGSRHPRVLSPVPLPGWAKCELEILECKEVPWPARDIEMHHQVQDSGWESRDTVYECKIRLLTGRTHQVRAQFASLNAPVIGDSMYMPAVVKRLKSLEVYPFRYCLGKVEDTDADTDSELPSISEKALEDWIALHGSEPECTVGLQASEISWDNGLCVYKASNPWWQ